MQKSWKLIKDDETIVKKLADELNISELTAKILFHRGITNVEEAEIFLNPESKQEFNNPFLMKGMSKAVERIIKAIDNQEKIVIYGDYDVDGMTSSALMVRTLKNLGATVDFYIPDRQNEGYGLNISALQKIADSGTKLLITVDCGISNANEIAEIKDKLDVIITDHHLPFAAIDCAVAVLDPHQEDCNYPDKNLCGVGVAFKLCQALNMTINNIDYRNYLTDIDLVALGTVADIVPLVGENRKIVRLGLKQMINTKNIGLRALLEVSNIDKNKKLNTNHLGFKIGPRLNSTGRLSTASKGVHLLITNNEKEAAEIAQELDRENTNRKFKEYQMLETANKKYIKLREEHGGDLSSIVVASENWHPGIVGLVAARLLEKHYLPTIVIAIDGDIARASCRSIRALHMKEALDYFSDYFTQYGGHAAAAGFSIRTKDIDKFREDFDAYVKKNLKEEDFTPVQEIDVFVHPNKLNLQLADDMEKLEPFGVSNPYPVFACSNVKGVSPRTMGQSKSHLSFFIKGVNEGQFDMRAICWNKGSFVPLIESELLDITFEPERNEFNGNISVQCLINSIIPSKENCLFPDRETMINIYKFLWQRANSVEFKPYDIGKFSVDYKKSSFASENPALNSAYTMFCAIQVFEELGLIYFNANGDEFIMPKSSKKLDLNESRFWRLNNNQ